MAGNGEKKLLRNSKKSDKMCLSAVKNVVIRVDV